MREATPDYISSTEESSAMLLPSHICLICSLRWFLLLLIMPIILIEIGVGCGQIITDRSNLTQPSSFSVYASSRGKGVPEKAMNMLNKAREILKVEQDQGKVKRLVDRRIVLEGKTQLCAEFSDEQVSDQFFNELHHFSRGVDLVNMKKELCPP